MTWGPDSPNIRWKTPLPGHGNRNLLFTVADKGVLVCRDPETGEILWKTRLPQRCNRPSPVAGDGKIYIHSSNGTTAVVAAAREFRLLAHNDLGEPGSNASPAPVPGRLLIRSAEHLVCIECRNEPGVTEYSG